MHCERIKIIFADMIQQKQPNLSTMYRKTFPDFSFGLPPNHSIYVFAILFAVLLNVGLF